MEISISLPLDNDGFLRRECPTCDQEFKWHSGPASQDAELHADPATYFCPLCGEPADPDSWWTQSQLDLAEAAAVAAATQELDEDFGAMIKDLNRGTSMVTFSLSGHIDPPDEPMPLTEPDDMEIIASPCHSYEPVKVPVELAGPFYCLVCGAAFAV